MKVRLISSDSTTDLTQGINYNVSDRVVTLTNPTSLKIQIYRETTTKPLVGWADAAVLRAADMTVHSTQLLHLSEETMDKVQDGGLAQDTNDGVWDARYNRIKNLLDPKDLGDAVTLSYIVANQTSLLNALKATGQDQNNSIVSNGNAQNARLIATGDKQNTRLTSTGDTQNKRLTDTGASYVTTMTTLKNTATTKASEASGSAELSKKWAMSATSPDGVSGNKSSKTWAEEAKTSASNANTSETNAKNAATNANTYRTQAAASARAAKISETNAKSSEVNAKASEEQAKIYTDVLKKPVAHLNLLERNKTYSIGDIAYSPNLPSWAYLECTSAGTTGASEPDFSSVKSGGG